MIRASLFSFIFLIAVGAAPMAWAQDDAEAEEKKPSHEGYYYPAITSKEVYVARARQNPDVARQSRIRFVTELTALQSRAAYAPQYAVFAKGSDAQKLIIVALNDDVFGSLYRARGVLAQLTAFSRRTPFFIENNVDDIFTFFDLLRYLGFERLTISDGKSFSHQVDFE